MNPTAPALHDLVRQLLADWSARADPSGDDANPVTRACEKLRIPLSKHLGPMGFYSLLSRALTMARRQVPELAGVRVTANGSLEGFAEMAQAGNTAEAAQHGGEALLGELLNLLVTFIGEPMTRSLVSECPELPWDTMAPNT